MTSVRGRPATSRLIRSGVLAYVLGLLRMCGLSLLELKHLCREIATQSPKIVNAHRA